MEQDLGWPPLPLWSFLVSFPPGGKVGLERKPRPAVLLGRNPSTLCVGSSLEAEVREKGALTARDGAVGTWLRWTPHPSTAPPWGSGCCSLHISISPPLIGSETSARGMTTSSPSPRKRQRAAAKHVLLGKAPTYLLVAPSSVCPLPSQGPAGPHLPHSSVYPVTLQSRVRPLTLRAAG